MAAEISVVIATYDRAELLARSLEGFIKQCVPKADFEVIVIDDGSKDETAEVCRRYAARLPLRSFRLAHSGRSAAKNLGLFLSQAPLVLFFDDDDLPDTNLLREHLRTHRQHPEEVVAVLGYTTWAPELHVSPLMEYITEVGQQLFAYASLMDGQELDYRYFWEGRLSCKRALLVKHAIHDQRLQYSIDIELGYRLSKFGLRVVFNRSAVSYMLRPIGYEDFCRRCEEKGRAQAQISRFHADASIRRYCRVNAATGRWQRIQPSLAENMQRVRALEITLAADPTTGSGALLRELRQLYGLSFEAFQTKGVVEGLDECRPPDADRKQQEPPPRPRLSIIIPVWNVAPELSEMTAQHIERLEAVGRITTEILLIDNASPYPKSYRGCTTIRFDKNRGVAAAWNAGALAATGDILCFLNNDVWVEPGWDTGLCEAAGDGRRIAFPYTDHGDRKGFRCPDTAGVAGWCFALTRSVWEEIGPFDEAFGPAFYEDTDFFTRAWRLGIDLCPVPDANVHHRRRTSANQLPDVDSLFQANKQRYALKYGLDTEAVPPYYARRIVQYRSGRFA